MPCPDDDTYAELLQGTLPPERAAELEVHLDGCPACTDLVLELGKVYGPTRPPAPSLAPVEEGAPRSPLLDLEVGMAVTHLVWGGLTAPLAWRTLLDPASPLAAPSSPFWLLAIGGYVLVWAPTGALCAVAAAIGLALRRRWAVPLAGLHAVVSLPSLVLAPLGGLVLREVARHHRIHG